MGERDLKGETMIQAVILDWAGVTIDHGSCAPVRVFLEVFQQEGIELTLAEARGPMGTAKRDHIIALTRLSRVQELWKQRHGQLPDQADIQRMYEAFLPLQLDMLARQTEVIPGIPEAISQLRSRGIRIGSTTGYTRNLMEVVIPIARRGGYAPDTVVCADDVPHGRPAPWMNFTAAMKLGVYPLSRIVVVDDTKVGIEAGRNAGAITVAISRTGNAMGLSAAELDCLPQDEVQRRLAQITDDFMKAGADAVLESVADLPAWLESR